MFYKFETLKKTKYINMRKIYLIFLFLFFTFINVKSQIGGISASKLATLCAGTVPNKGIEFEPAFGFGYSSRYWDNDGNLQNLSASGDSVFVNSGFGFRFSYGAYENLEIGTAFPADMSGISFGAKYKIPFESKISIAALLGTNIPLGNQFFDTKNRSYDFSTSAVGGIVMTYDFTDNFAIDFDLQYQDFIQKVEGTHNNDMFVNCDIGYYITEGFQVIIGANYQQYNYTDTEISLLTLNPGVTIERAENFLLVLNFPYDITGKNIEQSAGFGFALTISLN